MANATDGMSLKTLQNEVTAAEVEKYLADLVICAARFGDGIVDLDAACAARLAEKFPAPTSESASGSK